MKLYIEATLCMLMTSILLYGCATTKDLTYTSSQIEDLKKEVEVIKGKLSSEVRKDWADLGTSVDDLRREIKVLRANVEEDRDLIRRLTDDLHVLKRNYEAAISNPHKEEVAASPPASPPLPTEDVPAMEEDMEGAYQKAYTTFKKGDYDQAMKMFKDFLAKHPKSEYADNAQYWIGECYYRQEDHERAILEYEKVIKQYPHGDKIPSALLKQGFAFLNLGDKMDAKIILQKVVKEYPQSPQAEIAAQKLKALD